jgi:hypothetical protein
MELGSVPRRRKGVELQTVGDQAVMLDEESTMARGLNGTAVRVWGLIDGKRTVAEIAAALEEDAEPEQVQRDVLAFVNALQARQLLE